MNYLAATIGAVSCLAISQAFGAINVISDTDTGGKPLTQRARSYIHKRETRGWVALEIGIESPQREQSLAFEKSNLGPGGV